MRQPPQYQQHAGGGRGGGGRGAGPQTLPILPPRHNPSAGTSFLRACLLCASSPPSLPPSPSHSLLPSFLHSTHKRPYLSAPSTTHTYSLPPPPGVPIISVSPRQIGNPILKYLKNVPYQIVEGLVPDYGR